jgi:hypothetical protein
MRSPVARDHHEHDRHPTRRRWLQFGLGTMLAAVIVIAALALGSRERHCGIAQNVRTRRSASDR